MFPRSNPAYLRFQIKYLYTKASWFSLGIVLDLPGFWRPELGHHERFQTSSQSSTQQFSPTERTAQLPTNCHFLSIHELASRCCPKTGTAGTYHSQRSWGTGFVDKTGFLRMESIMLLITSLPTDKFND